jgi:large subunit ribosomal protein L27
MAHKKAAAKSKQQTRPNPKYLGVKVAMSEKVNTGAVLVRQRGTKFQAGQNVSVGRDHTLFSMINGEVKFGQKLGKKIISVV